MKKYFTLGFIGLVIATLVYLFYPCSQTCPAPTYPVTTLTVKNSHPADTITAYLTLGGCEGCLTDVKGIFGITDSGAQGSFTLIPNQELSYSSPAGSAFEGNICFLAPPINCPNGNNICEFALNNNNTSDTMAQETVEISCVAGVTYIAKYTLKDGGNWTATTGYDSIRTFHNDTIGANSGKIGVFPYGCDDCTKSTDKRPSCVTNPEPAQKLPICNVSRNARQSGGSVLIEYLRPIGVPLK